MQNAELNSCKRSLTCDHHDFGKHSFAGCFRLQRMEKQNIRNQKYETNLFKIRYVLHAFVSYLGLFD